MTTVARLGSGLRDEVLTRVAPLFGRRYTKGTRSVPHVWDMAELCRQQDAINQATATALAVQSAPRFMVNHVPLTPAVANAIDLAQAAFEQRVTEFEDHYGKDAGATLRRLDADVRRQFAAVTLGGATATTSEHTDPGTPPPRPLGGPTARGVAFCVYGSQASELGTQKAGV